MSSELSASYENAAARLLARAAMAEQAAFIGEPGGRARLPFLHPDDFARDYAAFSARGVRFARAPAPRACGTVAVFEDLYGNLRDLAQLANQPANSPPAGPT